jgi:hypothetical protein
MNKNNRMHDQFSDVCINASELNSFGVNVSIFKIISLLLQGAWLKCWSACSESARPRVQIPIPPKDEFPSF